MTKEKFNELVLGLLDEVSSLPDDIWDSCYPTMSAVVMEPDGKRLKVTVGLDEAETEVEVWAGRADDRR